MQNYSNFESLKLVKYRKRLEPLRYDTIDVYLCLFHIQNRLNFSNYPHCIKTLIGR